MRNVCCAVLLGLMVVICLQSYAAGQNAKAPAECCFNFFIRPVPLSSITMYEETRSDCPKAGVVFATKKGSRICADPGLRWVKRAMDKIDLQLVEGST